MTQKDWRIVIEHSLHLLQCGEFTTAINVLSTFLEGIKYNTHQNGLFAFSSSNPLFFDESSNKTITLSDLNLPEKQSQDEQLLYYKTYCALAIAFLSNEQIQEAERYWKQASSMATNNIDKISSQSNMLNAQIHLQKQNQGFFNIWNEKDTRHKMHRICFEIDSELENIINSAISIQNSFNQSNFEVLQSFILIHFNYALFLLHSRNTNAINIAKAVLIHLIRKTSSFLRHFPLTRNSSTENNNKNNNNKNKNNLNIDTEVKVPKLSFTQQIQHLIANDSSSSPTLSSDTEQPTNVDWSSVLCFVSLLRNQTEKYVHRSSVEYFGTCSDVVINIIRSVCLLSIVLNHLDQWQKSNELLNTFSFETLELSLLPQIVNNRKQYSTIGNNTRMEELGQSEDLLDNIFSLDSNNNLNNNNNDNNILNNDKNNEETDNNNNNNNNNNNENKENNDQQQMELNHLRFTRKCTCIESYPHFLRELGSIFSLLNYMRAISCVGVKESDPEQQKQGINFLKASIKLDPSFPYSHLLYSYLCYCLENYDESIRSIQNIVRQKYNTVYEYEHGEPVVTALYLLGCSYNASGNQWESIQCFQRVLASNPNSIESMLYISTQYSLLSQPEAKRKMLEFIWKTLIAEKRDSVSIENNARTNLRFGPIIRLFPVNIVFEMALTSLKTNQISYAIDALKYVIHCLKHPEEHQEECWGHFERPVIDVYRCLIYGLLQNDECEEALTICEHVLYVKSKDIPTLLYKADCLTCLERVSEALEVYNLVVFLIEEENDDVTGRFNTSEMQSIWIEAMSNKAVLLSCNQRGSEAIETLQQCIEYDPDNMFVVFNLCVLLLRYGNIEEACAKWMEHRAIPMDRKEQQFYHNLLQELMIEEQDMAPELISCHVSGQVSRHQQIRMDVQILNQFIKLQNDPIVSHRFKQRQQTIRGMY